MIDFQGANLTFDSLSRHNESKYRCTTTITSPYLINMVVLNATKMVTVNRKMIVCTYSSYSDVLPYFIGMCPVLMVDGGNITVTDKFRGDNATYNCNSGFELLNLTLGSDVRTCRTDGTWTVPEPQCLGNFYYVHVYMNKYCMMFVTAQCPELQAPANALVFPPARRLSGFTATYTCRTGFELLDPESNKRTCQPDGTWSLPEPQCVGK